jgi:hypothetical protein
MLLITVMVNDPSSEIPTEPGLKVFTTERGPGVGVGAIETLGELLHVSLLSDFDELLPEPELADLKPEFSDLSDDELPDVEPEVELPDLEPEPEFPVVETEPELPDLDPEPELELPEIESDPELPDLEPELPDVEPELPDLEPEPELPDDDDLELDEDEEPTGPFPIVTSS